jgi:hypothetical protein
LDPGQEIRNSRIHARVLALAATDSPTDDTDLGPATTVHHQRATTVTLEKFTNNKISFLTNIIFVRKTYTARVLSSLSGANKVLNDSTGGGASVLVAALAVGPDGDADLLQNRGLGSALPQTTPSDDGGGAAGVKIASGRQADGADHVGESDRRVQGEDGNVVVLQRKRGRQRHLDARANA